MEKVGFTTGSLYLSNLTCEEIIRLYSSLGADAIELSFLAPKELMHFNPSDETKEIIRGFKHVSIHAPCKGINYNSKDSGEVISRLTELCSELPIEGIVLHPDTVEDFYMLDKSNLPFLIENMDKRKKYGTLPEQIKELKEKYNFGFVLDVQHAYEHDSKMNLARELIDVMGDRLKHMHVSGQNETESHVPTHYATNRRSIAEILRLELKVPKILEGVLFENFKETIQNELIYIRTYESV